MVVLDVSSDGVDERLRPDGCPKSLRDFDNFVLNPGLSALRNSGDNTLESDSIGESEVGTPRDIPLLALSVGLVEVEVFEVENIVVEDTPGETMGDSTAEEFGVPLRVDGAELELFEEVVLPISTLMRTMR